jgi:hypothetical protein
MIGATTIGTKGGNDGVDLDHTALAGFGINATTHLIQWGTAGIGDALIVIEPNRLLIVDPLQRHSSHIGPQDFLVQSLHDYLPTVDD